MRKWVALVVMVVLGLALAFGTAVAKDNPISKGELNNQGDSSPHGHHKLSSPGTNDTRAQLANQKTTARNGQISQNEDGTDTAQNEDSKDTAQSGSSYAFKGILTKDGEDDTLQMKVEKASKSASSSVGKNVEFNVTPSTAIYLDKADEQNPNLDAKLSDLKVGDTVLIEAKKAQDADSFTASMVSAEIPPNDTTTTPTNNVATAPNDATTTPNNNVVAAPTNNGTPPNTGVRVSNAKQP